MFTDLPTCITDFMYLCAWQSPYVMPIDRAEVVLLAFPYSSCST
jgi:hypothetical protein